MKQKKHTYVNKTLNLEYPSFLLANINCNDLLESAHTSHITVSILTAQTSCHIVLDEGNCNQMVSFAAANQWNLAYLVGTLGRKNFTT